MTDNERERKLRKLAVDLHDFRINCKKIEAQALDLESAVALAIGEEIKSGEVHDTRTTPESERPV